MVRRTYPVKRMDDVITYLEEHKSVGESYNADNN